MDAVCGLRVGWASHVASQAAASFAGCRARPEAVVAWLGAVYPSVTGRSHARAGACAGAGCGRGLDQPPGTASSVCLPVTVRAAPRAQLPCTTLLHSMLAGGMRWGLL